MIATENPLTTLRRWMAPSHFVHPRWRISLIVLVVMLGLPAFAQESDPDKLLQEADRLAWFKAWTRAAPLYGEARRLFTARGDRRNALYAEVNQLRGELPRLAVPEVSQRLADYLEDPIIQSDDALRLRCLVIKGETDEDLDPFLAEQSWREALEIANRLGDEGWAKVIARSIPQNDPSLSLTTITRNTRSF